MVNEWLRANTTVTVSVPSVIESTNPFFVTKKDVLNIYSLIYEPLIKLDESNEPTPYLAKSWIADEEGTTWTFILRDGVYWQGTNREINSQDVIFTLDMMKEIRDQSIHCRVMGYLKSWRRVDDT